MWGRSRQPGRHRQADLPFGYRPTTAPAAATFLAEVRSPVAEPIGAELAPIPATTEGIPMGDPERVPLALHLAGDGPEDRSDGIWRA